MAEDGGDGSGQWVSGDGNVVISHVANSHITVSVDGDAARDVALRPGWWQLPAWLAGSSLAALLKPDVGVVPFSDVDGRLERLTGWAVAEGPMSVAVVAGAAGSGKTRLGGQLCRTLTDRKWVAGFVRRDAQPDEIERLAGVPVARCVVIDYAEAKADVAATVVDRLVASATGEHPLRVLLLTRATVDGSHDVRPLLRGRSSYLDVLLDHAAFMVLSAPTWASLDARRDLFNAAAAAFADRLGTASPPVPAELAGDLYDRPLTITMAAGLACLDPATAPTGQAELLDRLLEQEAAHWRRTAQRLSVTAAADLLLEIAAYATLAGAAERREAAELLARLPVLADATTERRAELAGWIHAASPGTRYWNPVEPDLIGEHLVATTIGDQSDIIPAALDGRDPSAVQQPIGLLARAAANNPDHAATWAEIIDERFVDLVDAARQQADATAVADLFEPSLAATLAFAVTQLDLTLDTLITISNHLPGPNLVLRPLQVAVGEQLVTRRRRLADANPAAHRPILATSLHNLSIWLGRGDEALAAIEEAVEILRPLTDDSSAAYQVDLANALSTWSLRLAEVDRGDEALAAIEEAVEILRPLTDDSSAAYRPILAGSLHNLSIRLADVGRPHEALAAVEEAVTILRPLPEPNAAARRPNLARSLRNLLDQLPESSPEADAVGAELARTRERMGRQP